MLVSNQYSPGCAMRELGRENAHGQHNQGGEAIVGADDADEQMKRSIPYAAAKPP